MKLLIIAGPYEADRIRKAALSAGFETVAVEPGESLSGWITASRPELIVMAPQIVHADPALALAKVRAVPRGRVPIFLVGDAADEARLRDLADGFFVRPIAPGPAARAGARHPDAARRRAAPAQGQQPRPGADGDGARAGPAASGPHGPTEERPAPGAPGGQHAQAARRCGAGRGADRAGARGGSTRARCWPSWAPGSTRSSTPSWTRRWRSRPRSPVGQAGSDVRTQRRGCRRTRRWSPGPTSRGRRRRRSSRRSSAWWPRHPKTARARLLARYAPVENGDYFAVLNVARDASVADLRRAHEKILAGDGVRRARSGGGGRAGRGDRRDPHRRRRGAARAQRRAISASRYASRMPK